MAPEPRAARLRVALPGVDVALESEVLAGAPDPARLERELSFLVEHGRHPSWAAAAGVLARWLQLPPTGAGATYGALTLTLTPEGASPVVHTARPAPYARETDKPWGWVDIVHETPAVGFYRLVLTRGVLPTHVHAVMEEVELVLDEGLEGWWDGRPAQRLPVGRRVGWAHGQPHGYRHVGDGPASLLCIDTPPFDPADERILGTEPPP